MAQILGAYSLQIWGVGVVRITFTGGRGAAGSRSKQLLEGTMKLGGEKTNKHKQLRGIVPEMGGGQIVDPG